MVEAKSRLFEAGLKEGPGKTVEFSRDVLCMPPKTFDAVS